MQRSGIVMTIKKTHAVVLTADGQFCRIPPSPQLEIGKEVSWVADVMPLPDFQVQSGKAKRRLRSGLWQRYGMAGVAASLLVAAGVWFATNTLYPAKAEAYAFVSMDINPSLLFQVDQNLKVVSFQGENQDGTTLLSSLNLKGMSLSNAMEQVIQQAASMNMLPAQDSILVATAPVNSSVSVGKIESEVQKDVKDAIQASPTAQNLKPTVYSLGLSSTVWKAANQAKIAPAKLAAYLVARDEGFNFTVSQLSGNTLKQVLAHPSSTAVNALSSDSPQVVEKWINEMEQSGLLSSEITKLITSPVPANNLTSSNSSSHKAPPSAPKNHSASGESVQNITVPSVKVQLGNTSFSVQIGSQAGSQTGFHKKPKKDKAVLPSKAQDNHNLHRSKDGGETINKLTGKLPNSLPTSKTSGASTRSSGDFPTSSQNSQEQWSKGSSGFGRSKDSQRQDGGEASSTRKGLSDSKNSFDGLGQRRLKRLENRLLNSIGNTSF